MKKNKTWTVIFPLMIGVSLVAVALIIPGMTNLAILLSLPWFCAVGLILLEEKSNG